jgi:hypothetical protein
MERTNYGEYNLTKYFNDTLFETLKEPMRKLGFPIQKREHEIKRKEFDLWFHNKKDRIIVIIECEIKGWTAYTNIKKLEEIGIIKNPNLKIILFQVFSPLFRKGKQRIDLVKDCKSLAKTFQKKYRKFRYYTLDINMDYNFFDRMLNSFQRNETYAEQKYGKILRNKSKHLTKRIVEIYRNMSS